MSDDSPWKLRKGRIEFILVAVKEAQVRVEDLEFGQVEEFVPVGKT